MSAAMMGRAVLVGVFFFIAPQGEGRIVRCLRPVSVRREISVISREVSRDGSSDQSDVFADRAYRQMCVFVDEIAAVSDGFPTLIRRMCSRLDVRSSAVDSDGVVHEVALTGVVVDREITFVGVLGAASPPGIKYDVLEIEPDDDMEPIDYRILSADLDFAYLLPEDSSQGSWEHVLPWEVSLVGGEYRMQEVEEVHDEGPESAPPVRTRVIGKELSFRPGLVSAKLSLEYEERYSQGEEEEWHVVKELSGEASWNLDAGILSQLTFRGTAQDVVSVVTEVEDSGGSGEMDSDQESVSIASEIEIIIHTTLIEESSGR